MGGDEGVNLVIPGAAKALIRRPDLRFRLYGDQKAVEPVLARYPRVAEVSVFEHYDILGPHGGQAEPGASPWTPALVACGRRSRR